MFFSRQTPHAATVLEPSGAHTGLGRRWWQEINFGGVCDMMEALGQDRGADDTSASLDRRFGRVWCLHVAAERDWSQGPAWKAGRMVSFSSPSRSRERLLSLQVPSKVPAGDSQLGDSCKWRQGAGSGRYIGERRRRQSTQTTAPRTRHRIAASAQRDMNGTMTVCPRVGMARTPPASVALFSWVSGSPHHSGG